MSNSDTATGTEPDREDRRATPVTALFCPPVVENFDRAPFQCPAGGFFSPASIAISSLFSAGAIGQVA